MLQMIIGLETAKLCEGCINSTSNRCYMGTIDRIIKAILS